MRRGTPEHPKTAALAETLGVELVTAVGILECLWHFTSKYARQGDIGRHSNPAIAKGCYWTGDPNTLVAALASVGWLCSHPDHHLVVHDWSDHLQQHVRMSLRKAGLEPIQCVCRLRDNSESKLSDAPLLSFPSPSSPSPSSPSLSLPKASPSCPEPAGRGSRATSITWTPDSGFEGIEEYDRSRWAAAYPACDLTRQIAAAHEWLLGNPAKARKASYRRYLTNWLARSQERGGDSRSQPRGGDPSRPRSCQEDSIADLQRKHDEQHGN